mmetsp:Transcript_42619/g.96352  ORF Transcript_42619/g.96352 Transcript_42619/m.96352 type:complete len:495 (+) Transcript_42619:65-1549(+)
MSLSANAKLASLVLFARTAVILLLALRLLSLSLCCTGSKDNEDTKHSIAAQQTNKKHRVYIVQGACGEGPGDKRTTKCGHSGVGAAQHGVKTLGACALRCLACPGWECMYVSFSPQMDDCSLFHICNLSSLARVYKQDVPEQCRFGGPCLQPRLRQSAGYQSAAVVGTRASLWGAPAVRFRPQAVCYTNGVARRCQPWGDSFSRLCETPQWKHVEASAVARLHHLREFVVAVVPRTNTSLIYWITPKSAHTTIVNYLLRRAPFRVVDVVSARESEHVKRERLADALAASPLEFTFVRDPIGHLASGLSQMALCLKIPLNGLRDALAIFEMFAQSRWNSKQCEEHHLYPQSSGYTFSSIGVNRLHFVGRVEYLWRDWNRLLSMIGEPPSMTRPPLVNQRKRSQYLAKHLSTFAAHPVVRRSTEWDLRCFGGLQLTGHGRLPHDRTQDVEVLSPGTPQLTYGTMYASGVGARRAHSGTREPGQGGQGPHSPPAGSY